MYIGSYKAFFLSGIHLLTIIYLDLVSELVLSELFTVKLTVYCPVLLYVYTGFFSVELPPSPNVHLHASGDPVLLSIKLTVRGSDPEAGDAEKAAVREFETAIYPVLVNELLPFSLIVVNATE